MLEYHAAYYRGEGGWYVVEVLDFPGALSQGRTLKSARWMIKDALKLMAETRLEEGEPLPRPNPRAKAGKDAILVEPVRLELRIHTPRGKMKRRNVIRHLESHGCGYLREGGDHTVYVNLSNRQQSSVPRHREIDPFLVRKICKELGIPIPSGR